MFYGDDDEAYGVGAGAGSVALGAAALKQFFREPILKMLACRPDLKIQDWTVCLSSIQAYRPKLECMVLFELYVHVCKLKYTVK